MSIALHLTNHFLRLFVKGHAGAPLVPAAQRKRLAALMRWLPLPQGVQAQSVAAAPSQALCPAHWLRVAAPQRTLLYLHGGGYFMGSPVTHQSVCAQLALCAQAQVLAPDYRLAPEHPFPAALDDALAWYRHLLDAGTPPAQIALVGDSAGGGLVTALLVAAREAGLPQPACAVLFSPWADLAGDSDSLHSCARSDVVFHPAWFAHAVRWYLAGRDARMPLASPVYADLRGLPPLRVYASAHETLRDDAIRLVQRARAQEVDATLVLRPRMPHVWPIMQHLPEARQDLREAAAFVQQHSPAASGEQAAAAIKPHCGGATARS